jgi:hypothetical protein
MSKIAAVSKKRHTRHKLLSIQEKSDNADMMDDT